MNLRYHTQNQIFRKLCHCRPVFNVRTKLYFHFRICHSLGVKYSVCINISIKVILVFMNRSIKFCGCCKNTLVRCSSCNRACIHQCYRRNLTILQLGTFSVREVSGRVTDTECIVCRSITSTKAGTTECCLHNRTGF